MPFAGFKNFDSCVRANSSKLDPQAYCATIMRAVESKQKGMSIDRHLPVFGETDVATGHIKLNPAKGDFVNTVIHEKLHRNHPTMSERDVQLKSVEIEATLTPRKIGQMMQEVEAETHEGTFAPVVHTVAGNVKSKHEGRDEYATR